MLEMLCRTYGVLLFAYPRQFRERYAAEMRRVFREKARDLLSAHGYFGIARYCGNVAWDLVVSVIREHAAARTAALLSIRITMLGCVAISFAISWFDLRHRPGLVTLMPQTLVLLEIYALVTVVTTRERNRIAVRLIRNATFFGVAAAGLLIVVVPSLFFFTARTTKVAAEMLLLTGLAGTWLGAAYSAARDSGSTLTGIKAAGWSAMVTALVQLTTGLVLWSLAVWKFSVLAVFIPIAGLNTWYPAELSTFAMTSHAMTQLLQQPLIGCALGIAGGVAGAWREERARNQSPTW